MLQYTKKIFFIFFLSLVTSGTDARIPLGAIKGTDIYIKTTLQHITPINGMVCMHTLIKNTYFLGDTNPESPLHTPFTSLTKQLFHDIEGLFNITQHPVKIATYFTPQTIAQIILTLERFDKEQKRALGELEKEALRQKIKQQTEENVPEDIRAKVWNDLDRFVDALALAYGASGHNSNDPSIFKYGDYAMLIAFLYEKGSSKKDWRDYLNTFPDTYFKLTKALWLNDTWEKQKHTYQNIPEIEERFKQKDRQTPGVPPMLGRSNPSTYTFGFLAQKLYSGSLLHPTGFRRVSYKGFEFPNCMQAMIIGGFLKNALLTNDFKLDPIEKAKETQTNWRIAPELISFCERFSNPSDLDSQQAHQAAAEFMHNRPYVTYRRFNQHTKPDEIDGFVAIPNLAQQLTTIFGIPDISHEPITYHALTFTKLTVGDRIYYAFDPRLHQNIIVYEIKPSLRNFITIVMQLLIEPLDGPNWTLYNTLLNKEFNSRKIDNVLQFFDFYKYGFVTRTDIDSQDLTKHPIVLRLVRDNSYIELVMHSRHGSAKLTAPELRNPFQIDEGVLFTGGANALKQTTLRPLIALNLSELQAFDNKHIIPLKYRYLFFNLDSERKIYEAIEQLSKLSTPNSFTKSLLIRLIKRLPFSNGMIQKVIAEGTYQDPNMLSALQTVDKASFKNLSLLKLFLAHVRFCWPLKICMVSFDKVFEGLEFALKNNLETCSAEINYITQLFLKEKNPKIVTLVRDFIGNTFYTGTPFAKRIACALYAALIETDNHTRRLPQKIAKYLPLISKAADEEGGDFLPESLFLFNVILTKKLIHDASTLATIKSLVERYIAHISNTPQDDYTEIRLEILLTLLANNHIDKRTFFAYIDQLSHAVTPQGRFLAHLIKKFIEAKSLNQEEVTSILHILFELGRKEPNNHALHIDTFKIVDQCNIKKLLQQEHKALINDIIRQNASALRYPIDMVWFRAIRSIFPVLTRLHRGQTLKTQDILPILDIFSETNSLALLLDGMSHASQLVESPGLTPEEARNILIIVIKYNDELPYTNKPNEKRTIELIMGISMKILKVIRNKNLINSENKKHIAQALESLADATLRTSRESASDIAKFIRQFASTEWVEERTLPNILKLIRTLDSIVKEEDQEEEEGEV